MDNASRSVTYFLEALQDAMESLGRDIWRYYLKRGTLPSRPFLTLSGRPFRSHEDDSIRQFHGSVVLGLRVKGADSKEYELTVDVHWDTERWTITTEAWVEMEIGGQDLLRQLPERVAENIGTCTEQLSVAIRDLIQFEDLIPMPQPSQEV